MSLYDEIRAAQQDLEKLRKTRIFNTHQEAANYANRHGLVLVELDAPATPPDYPPTKAPALTATKPTTTAWAAAPRDHSELKRKSDQNQKIAAQARAAGIINLMRQIQIYRDNLNDSRAKLGSASSKADPLILMTATTSLVQAKQQLQNAEESLIRIWNQSIALNKERLQRQPATRS